MIEKGAGAAIITAGDRAKGLKEEEQVGEASLTCPRGKSSTRLGAVHGLLLLLALATFREVHRHARVPRPSSVQKSGQQPVAARSSSPASDAFTTTMEREENLALLHDSSGQQEQVVDAPSDASPPEREPASNVVEECSCYSHGDESSDTTTTPCCQRAVLTNHKFGTILARSIVGRFRDVHRRSIHPDAFPTNGEGSTNTDYRHVVIVRNYPEAFVSGYLYHKSGRECWRTYNGAPVQQMVSFEWDRNVRMSAYDIGSHPPRNERSICQYLAEESEEDGMKVYMAVALNKWYQGINEYYRVVHDTDRENRTLFLCLGDYSDHDSQEQMFTVVMDWLYPGGHNYTLPPGMIPTSSDKSGHASPGNSTQRLQLLELVQQYDREIFNGTVAATNDLFGCRGTIHRARRR